MIYTPNGMIMENFDPCHQRAGLWLLSPILKPLEPYRDKIRGVHRPRPCPGRGPGRWGGRPWPLLRRLPDWRACQEDRRGRHHQRISMDQLVAKEFGDQTQIPSLELGLEPPSLVGSCDSGYSCAYTNTLSWTSPSTPLAGHHQSARSVRAAVRRWRQPGCQDPPGPVAPPGHDPGLCGRRRQKDVGPAGRDDKQKMDEYLQSVRDIEQRIQKVEQGGADAVALPAYVQAFRDSGFLRGLCPYDDRPAGSGDAGRHDPGRHLHDRARSLRPLLSGDRGSGRPPSLEPSWQGSGEDRQADQDQHPAHGTGGLLPQADQRDQGRREASDRQHHAAGRRQLGRSQPARPSQPAGASWPAA